jgi:hypothetical protein
MRELIVIALLLCLQNAMALTQRESLRMASLKISPVEFSVENEIQQGVKKMLFEQLKIKKSVITVDISINTYRLLRTHGLYQKNQIKDNLPGLDAPPNIAEEKLKLFVPTRNDVLTHISRVFINFSFPYKVDKKNQDIINEFVYEYLKSLKVARGGIRINYNEVREIADLYGKELKPEYMKSFTDGLSDPENKDSISMALMFLIILFLIVIMAVIFIFVKEFKKLQSGIVNSLKSIEVNVPESGMGGQKQETAAQQNAKLEQAKTYDQLKREIYKLFNESEDLFRKICQLCGSSNDIEMYFILKDVSNENMVGILDSSIPKTMNDGLNRYMKEASANPTDFYQRLVTPAENLLKSLWLARQDLSILDYGILNKKLAELNDRELLSKMEGLTDTEFCVVMTELPPTRAASILTNNSELLDSRGPFTQDILMTPELIKSVHIKLDSAHEAQVEEGESKLAGLANYLPDDVERKWAEKMGVTQTVLDHVTSEQIERNRSYFNQLDIDEMCELLAILDDEKKEMILAQLPEIKRNRVVLKGYKVTNRSYDLKSGLVKRLKTTKVTPTEIEGSDE